MQFGFTVPNRGVLFGATTIELMLEQAEAADRSGLFRTLWVGDSLLSRFVTVPLDLRSPEAITVLAGTITMTPGTVSADVSADGRALLVHCLETGDPAATAAAIKARYEHRLQRIFE